MSDWYDSNFGFRRQLVVIPPTLETIQEGNPLTVVVESEVWHSLNKLRTDDVDIRIVYLDPDSAATPVQIPVAHKLVYPEAEEQLDLLYVVFNAEKEIFSDMSTPSINMDYYIYYGNPNLTNLEDFPYSGTDYVMKLTPTDYNYSLTFSRPNEDWNNGISDKLNARFSLNFYGLYAKLNMMKGPERGLVEVKIDDNEPIYIDTYSAVAKEETVLTTGNELIPDTHIIRCRVTGDKNPTSSSYALEFMSFEYSIFIEAMQGPEEVNSTNSTVNFILGT